MAAQATQPDAQRILSDVADAIDCLSRDLAETFRFCSDWFDGIVKRKPPEPERQIALGFVDLLADLTAKAHTAVTVNDEHFQKQAAKVLAEAAVDTAGSLFGLGLILTIREKIGEVRAIIHARAREVAAMGDAAGRQRALERAAKAPTAVARQLLAAARAWQH
jgi:hypothetical protein